MWPSLSLNMLPSWAVFYVDIKKVVTNRPSLFQRNYKLEVFSIIWLMEMTWSLPCNIIVNNNKIKEKKSDLKRRPLFLSLNPT